MKHLPATTTIAVTLVLFASCAQSPHHATPQHVEPPAANADKPVQLAGLHNVVTYAPDLVCGGVPEGEEGLATLAAMGIKTIVSVDGATPDVAIAEKLGMHYVHLPISYDTVTPERQKQLAQAIASVPGPVYMHCHHGKHRSAAALGTALVLAGKLTPEQATERMKVSGTAKEYQGLWKAVGNAKPLDAAQLKIDPSTLPSISKVTGMVATMSEIDLVFDLVKQAKAAKWKAPEEHPDLVASKETKRLHSLFAGLVNDADSKKLPADYQTRLGAEIEKAAALDAAMQKGDLAAADQLFDAMNKGCKECHAKYRDNE